MCKRLTKAFFARDTVEVARDLLGKRLVRVWNGQKLIGLIQETEAYCGEHDSACHAFRGLTPRTQVMYGPAGHFYVYLIYGMHHMLNIVTCAPGEPQAVLIRALWPIQGIEHMHQLRQTSKRSQLTNGPGKLCQALHIDRRFNGQSVEHDQLWLETAADIPAHAIHAGPRVGIAYAHPRDQARPWRFQVATKIIQEAF